MLNEIVLVTTSEWNGGNADKNGAKPMSLKAVAGKNINKSILAGTLAANSGFELNKTYLVQISEKEANKEYGRQFQFTNLGEQKGLDVIKAAKELGSPVIVDVTTEETVNEQAQFAAPSRAQPKTVFN